MKFSERTSWELEENTLTVATRDARALARAQGRELFDLTASNPTFCGFHYDPALWLAPLASPNAMRYEPDSLGMAHAREAVARYYRDHGVDLAIETLCLTTSTSEAYSFLFRLLCNPGDEVLIARPSYPLFDYIAQLDAVRLREYPLWLDPGATIDGDHAWHIDFQALEELIGERTRAIIVVHPNNPTGSLVSPEERAQLDRLCAKHSLALIVDEVFLDYAIGGADAKTFADGGEALTFVLSGLSKVCALPQMKLSWIAASGPKAVVRAAMERIEIIADTFLSVNAPTQWSLQPWLRAREAMQRQIRERVTANLALLDQRLKDTQAQRMPLEGGWTAILRVPRDRAITNGELADFALGALHQGVLVQPGDFYGLGAGRCVLSLLTPPEIWSAGLELLPID
ncbi:Aspartate/methionine/tyrosine aminotransferase [Bryocella elongata]|uniref:alanine transaminase n=1 Tax=Bryocella elongata TaxID=863522 RepID=A0A1H5UAW1_9BACT|nr:pyridoxal phosphate-dependent aminotransferase [Bryocella elongata]SEF72173.1 Aspartate/methionine/tyrosine aminotransferase [Bryocella elongata]